MLALAAHPHHGPQLLLWSPNMAMDFDNLDKLFRPTNDDSSISIDHDILYLQNEA